MSPVSMLLDRKVVLDLLARPLGFGTQPSFIFSYDEMPSPRHVMVVWANEKQVGKQAYPDLLVLPDGESNEFFSWALTFLPQMRPLSSIIRVVEYAQYRQLRSVVPQQLALQRSAILLGAVIGEAMTYMDTSSQMDSLPLSSFYGLFGSSVLQANMSGYSLENIDMLRSRWEQLKVGALATKNAIDNKELVRVWTTLLQVVNRHMVETRSSRVMLCDLTSLLAVALDESTHLDEVMRLLGIKVDKADIFTKLAIEDRVVVFSNVISKIQDQKIDPPIANLVVGYLASHLSDGSLVHASILKRILQFYPVALVWYGIFAANRDSLSFLASNGHLGYRLLMQFSSNTKSIFDNPVCDLSWHEYACVLREHPNTGTLRIRQRNQGQQLIELQPLVLVSIKPTPKNVIEDSEVLATAKVESVINDTTDLLVKAIEMLNNIHEVRNVTYDARLKKTKPRARSK